VSDADGARELIRSWLYEPDANREAILEALPDEADDPRALVRSCMLAGHEGREPGVFLGEGFELPHLRERYPDEELSFCVPESYDAAKPTGLLVLLHGGGSDTPRAAARRWMEVHEAGDRFGDVLPGLPCITVAPGNLQLPTHKRWSNPQSDAYVLAVIEEAAFRFNIDPDRVCIAGQSMGGFGAFHIVQTIGDRFASVGCHAGAWYYAFFEGLLGVDFYLMQGAADFVPGERPRFTEAAFARMAHAILSGYHLSHTYAEHDGGHSFTEPPARECFLGFLEHAPNQQRALPAEIATCSHKGAFRLYESPHWWWLSIGRTHYGSVEMDHLEPTEPIASYCTTDFRHYTVRVPAGTVHARNEGGNCLSLQARNIEDLTVWLSREMVDFAQPVRVLVNGEVAFEDTVRPSLRAALQSFDRRRDPGMLFEARIDLTLKPDDWARQTQLWPDEPAPEGGPS